MPITGASTIVPLVHPSSNTSRIRIWDADFDEMNTFARAEADTMAEVVQDLLGAAPDAFGETVDDVERRYCQISNLITIRTLIIT